jgi:hypothetical protein
MMGAMTAYCWLTLLSGVCRRISYSCPLFTPSVVNSRRSNSSVEMRSSGAMPNCDSHKIVSNHRSP